MTPLSAARVRAGCRTSLLAAAGLMVSSCGGDYEQPSFPPFYQDGQVVVADFDGDGTPDVAVVQSYINGPAPHAGYVAIYLQTAPGVFAFPVRYPIGPDPWALAAGDITGTGHVDLVATSPSTMPGVPDSGQISILLHDPSHPGLFLAPQMIATGGGGDAVAIGDVNGDGHADIVVADGSVSDANAFVFIQSATSPGTFAAPVALSLGANRGANDVTIHDMDGDGRNDIVLAVSDNNVEILYDNGAGGFNAPVLLPAGINPQGVAVADVDGDGRPDIVVTNAGYAPFGATGGASVTVLRQIVAGSFAASSITVPDGAVQSVIADLDHDGLPDIGVLSFPFIGFNTPSQVSILRQSAGSPGSFSLTVTYNGPLSSSFIAAGDINGDGYTDLVLNNPASVMLQQPAMPGTFALAKAL